MGTRKILSFVFLCGLLLSAPSLSFAGVDRIPSARASSAPAETEGYIPDQGAAPSLAPTGQTSSSQAYVLGVGDRIRMTVFGEADLSGDYEVGSTGFVALPLIGDVKAAGQPLQAFEQAVKQKLSQGYLRDPRVSAQVVNYRPFFILGEVAKPGSYPYVNGMTVLNAVALAGGYTYRADRSDVTVTRSGDGEKQETKVPETAVIMPGDIIRVPERFF